MKNQLIALAVTVLLAACGDKPRGPLEVQGKTFMDREFPVQFEFSGRDKGRLWNVSTDQSIDFQYTLEDKKLMLEYTQPNSKEVQKELQHDRAETTMLYAYSDILFKNHNGVADEELKDICIEILETVQDTHRIIQNFCQAVPFRSE